MPRTPADAAPREYSYEEKGGYPSSSVPLATLPQAPPGPAPGEKPSVAEDED